MGIPKDKIQIFEPSITLHNPWTFVELPNVEDTILGFKMVIGKAYAVQNRDGTPDINPVTKKQNYGIQNNLTIQVFTRDEYEKEMQLQHRMLSK